VKEATILMNELEERSGTQYIAGTYAGLSAVFQNLLERIGLQIIY
jgi:hypothetical protein